MPSASLCQASFPLAFCTMQALEAGQRITLMAFGQGPGLQKNGTVATRLRWKPRTYDEVVASPVGAKHSSFKTTALHRDRGEDGRGVYGSDDATSEYTF
ncbi:Uu.00g051310.m01.CDS01 [Anthostomella pinea]|uniref:Uu.00g051310.m01.CDS01 n=1 Tax=Anthostomella pinea TaxID=933095 RepID=A0AAI8YML4_9PEZI|nr:Uu.00g051310.m01.CDS01 [Anthostomella pinea]